jgi:hypothetical protein
MALINQKNKFETKTHKKSLFTESDFFKWTSNNFYRTSYYDMKSKVRFNLILLNHDVRAPLIEKIANYLNIKALYQE